MTQFRIANTFTDSLSRLTSEIKKLLKQRLLIFKELLIYSNHL